MRDSILCALEGSPRYTTKMAMDDGDSSLRSIMDVLDSVYSGANMYSALMSKLNTIQQGNVEAAKDYYECVVQLRVMLQEFLHFMFQPGDLEYHAKNAFFNGLWPEYQAMVVHKQDDPQASIRHLLIAVHECKENEAQHRKSRWVEYANHTPCPLASPPTEPTIQILISGDQITITRIRLTTTGRITTMDRMSPFTPCRWSLLWRSKPKRITSRSTSTMIAPHRKGMM